MRRKLLLLTLLGVTYIYWTAHQPSPIQRSGQLPITQDKRVLISEIPPVQQEKLKTISLKNNIKLKAIPFEKLPGWHEVNIKRSFHVFKESCKTFLKQEPSHAVGSKRIKLKAKDWHPACRAALAIHDPFEGRVRQFFETWFYPIEFAKQKPIHGLFTGYYMPQLKGNLVRTKEYNTPIYGMPENLTWKSKSKHYYTREEIDKGALKDKAPVIAWINSPIDRLFLEIEGSGIIQLTNGERMVVGYAGENGAPYTSIGHVLIQKGVLTKDNASKARIKRYLEEKPQVANTILHKNKSFVFFEPLKHSSADGAQGTALTPGYSLAIDKEWIPLGAPLWLSTAIPDKTQDKKFHRLMVAQDTGGAINGLMRGDIFWGAGKTASYLGEHMKHEGRYWLLLPKQVFAKNITS